MFRGSPPHGRLLDMTPHLGTSLLTSRTATLVVGPLHWDPGRENVTRTQVKIYRTVDYNKKSFPKKKFLDVADLEGQLEEGIWKFPSTQVALNESEKDSLEIRSALLYLYTYSPTSISIYQVRDVEDRADLLRAVDEDQARLPDSAQPHRPDTFPRG